MPSANGLETVIEKDPLELEPEVPISTDPLNNLTVVPPSAWPVMVGVLSFAVLKLSMVLSLMPE